jgi:hypothetical protein
VADGLWAGRGSEQAWGLPDLNGGWQPVWRRSGGGRTWAWGLLDMDGGGSRHGVTAVEGGVGQAGDQ